MKFTFPHFFPKPKFVQPDYNSWQEVKLGMTREEVIELLGPPQADEYYGGKPRHNDAYYSYGYLQMPMLPHPRAYSFLIGFDEDHCVFTKIDPFNGRFSQDGLPTAPELIIPVNDTVFNHFPRILDCRWFPCSGSYPITYAIQIEIGQPHGDPEFRVAIQEDNLAFPFFTTNFPGAMLGRMRVQGRNSKGEGNWSDYRNFEFLQ